MTDHKAFLKSLPEEVRSALTERSDRPGLARLALHFGLIAFCAYWIAMEGAYWGVLVPVQGVLIVFLFTLEHECTHKTPFRTEWLNEWVGRASGLLILQPFVWFRYFHLAHHRYTNLPDKDPELMAGGKPESWPAFLWHLGHGRPSWGFWGCLGRPRRSPWLSGRAEWHRERQEAILRLLGIPVGKVGSSGHPDVH